MTVILGAQHRSSNSGTYSGGTNSRFYVWQISFVSIFCSAENNRSSANVHLCSDCVELCRILIQHCCCELHSSRVFLKCCLMENGHAWEECSEAAVFGGCSGEGEGSDGDGVGGAGVADFDDVAAASGVACVTAVSAGGCSGGGILEPA